MSKQVQSEEVVEMAFQMIHDFAHEHPDILRKMLEHVEDTDEDAKPRRKKSSLTEEVVHSKAESLEDKLKEAAKHLRDIAEQMEAGEMDIPADVSEIQVEVHISGKS